MITFSGKWTEKYELWVFYYFYMKILRFKNWKQKTELKTENSDDMYFCFLQLCSN